MGARRAGGERAVSFATANMLAFTPRFLRQELASSKWPFQCLKIISKRVIFRGPFSRGRLYAITHIMHSCRKNGRRRRHRKSSMGA